MVNSLGKIRQTLKKKITHTRIDTCISKRTVLLEVFISCPHQDGIMVQPHWSTACFFSPVETKYHEFSMSGHVDFPHSF